MKRKLLIITILLICLACGKSSGHLGEPCEDGGNCSYNLECSEKNICEHCGADGELCCQSGLLRTGCSFGECGEDGRCRKCGTENEVCCSDGCWPFDLTCGSENFCVACGGSNQPCCEGECFGITCGGDGICHDEICDEAGNCQPCGNLDTPCCTGSTCKKDAACSGEGICVNCGSLDELACVENVCDAWYTPFDGTCRNPFAVQPGTDTKICSQMEEQDIRRREHSSWCYWYAAYYKQETSPCNWIEMGEMQDLCNQKKNPDDYFVIITTE